jgi:hypothetical protein
MLRRIALVLLAAAPLNAQAPAPTTGSFDFQLSSDNGKTVVGASVTIKHRDGKTFSGKTGPDGHLRLADLPTGGYNILAFDAPGYRRSHGSYSDDFQIRGGRKSELSFRLKPIGTIQGTVTDDAGKPIAGATVLALAGGKLVLKEDRKIYATASTDSQGRYLLSPSIAPSSFVTTTADPFPLIVKAFVSREQALKTSQAYIPGVADATQAEQLVDLSLRRTPTFHIRGRVTGVPVTPESPMISISDCSESPEKSRNASVALQGDGSFDAAGITPGFYCVEFARSRPLRVTVTDRDTDQVELAAPRP